MRLEALAELAKEGTIDREEYVRQTKLLGGDVKSTHLVKGLDYALLEKVRRGEDVMAGEEAINEEEEEAEDEDMEDKLERVLEQEVVPVERKEEKKKGVQAAPVPKTRTEILAALKESRRAAKEAAQPSLGAKFKKIGQPKVKVKEKPKEEEEEEEAKREKVKYVTLPDGRVKKMVKREKPKKVELEAPDPMSAPLGMMPPPPKPSAMVEEEDDDIFEGAGAEYDPLAGLQDDSSSSSSEEGEAPEPKKLKPENEQDTPSTTSPSTTLSSAITMPPPPPPPPKTNYFNEPTSATPDSSTYTPPSASSLLSDPALVAALAKASALRPLSSSSSADAEKAKRHAALLESADRDAFDVDFGFGGSRDFGDEDDDDGYQTKKKGGAKRKRGGEKKVKKGDKNDAGVVGKIVEERYGKGK